MALEFTKTRKAIARVEELISCGLCKQRSSELLFIGSCDHVFCSHCQSHSIDNHCPICSIPIEKKKARPVRQLAEISELCSRLKNELSELPAVTSKSTSGGRKREEQSTSSPYQTKRKKLDPCHSQQSEESDQLSLISLSSSQSTMDPKKINKKGESLLHLACQKGDLDAVNQLLSGDDAMDPNVKDNANWTPLHEASIAGHSEIVKCLLDAGAFVDPVGDNWSTPLQLAALHNRVDVVKILIDYGADSEAKTRSGHTALTLATRGQEIEALIRQALKRGKIIPKWPPRKKYHVIGISDSSLSHDQIRKFLKMISLPQFVGKVRRVPYYHQTEVTHLVVGSDPTPRSFKYLNAILTGKWIVAFDWITACIEQGHIVNEEQFEITGSLVIPASGGPKRARLNFAMMKPGLFAGCQFYLCGEFRSPNLTISQTEEIIQCGGGVIIRRPPSNDIGDTVKPYHADDTCKSNTFIVYQDPRYLKQLHRRTGGIPKVPISWLVDCIDHFRILPIPNDQVIE